MSGPQHSSTPCPAPCRTPRGSVTRWPGTPCPARAVCVCVCVCV
ncbi:MAG: hypothetical protein P4L40_22530 [Terracidiphilus sp.]|nr:hypothetical protein [Terracidiphilus sp.]